MVEDNDDKVHLRILIADELEARLDAIAEVVDDLGHTVVARALDVARVAEETRREPSDVAIVGLGDESRHALGLISEIVRQASRRSLRCLSSSARTRLASDPGQPCRTPRKLYRRAAPRLRRVHPPHQRVLPSPAWWMTANRTVRAPASDAKQERWARIVVLA